MSPEKSLRRRLAARARFRADAPEAMVHQLPRKPVIWPKTARYDYEPEAQHRAKLEALLAQATKTPGDRYYTTPVGHRMELLPGQRYEPFRRMSDEQYRSLPLKLPVIGPRCSACGRWATWDMIVPAAA